MSNRPVLLAGNWKMNHGPLATREFFSKVILPSKLNATARIYAPYISLTSALEVSKTQAAPVQIGAQNIHFEKSGAFTGEISGPLLRELNIDQTLVGHSERRQYFNETDETVLKRTESALNQGFEVLLCIGETLTERNSGTTEAVISKQLKLILASELCIKALGTKLHIAYEPVWAIGTGVTATPEQAEEAHRFIRSLLSKLDEVTAQKTLILYGGSVTPDNFKTLLSCPNIDGGLVGGASLKPESFSSLWSLIE